MTDIWYLLEIAHCAALEAGKAIMQEYHSGEFSAEIKPDKSPITQADKTAHQIIAGYLSGKTNLPVLSEEGASIDFRERKDWEYFWLIDPLDGTKEFIHKNGEFTVNIALVERGVPIVGVIYVPCTDTLYYGSKETGVYKNEKGKLTRILPLTERNQLYDLLVKEHITVLVSRSHPSGETKTLMDYFKNAVPKILGSSLKFMLLLENKAAIYPRFGSTMEWDTAAAHAILNASNRGVYQTDLKSELHYNKPNLKNPFFLAF